MSAADHRTGFGVFRVGDRLIGVPFDCLSEVCVVPRVSGLLVPESAFLGAFDLRGAAVPLIDLEVLAGLPFRQRSVRKAAIVQQGNRITAIALDDIVSLTEAAPTPAVFGGSEPSPREPDADDDMGTLFVGGFLFNGEVVGCLNVPALFRRHEVATIDNIRTSKRSADVSGSRKHLVFTAGGASFGIDVAHIAATVPRRVIDTSEIGSDGGPCLGFIEHQGWKVPVVHTSRILNLGTQTDMKDPETVVLRLDDKLFGLAVESTDRLMSIPIDAVQVASPALVARGLVPKVFVSENDTQIFLLDYDAFKTSGDLANIANLAIRREAERVTTQRQPGSEGDVTPEAARYLVFNAGRRLAVPAEQVSHIIHMPQHVVPSADMPANVLGFFAVDGQSVPLVRLTDAAPSKESGFVLLVAVGERQIGFAADQICSMRTSEFRISGGKAAGDEGDLVQLRDPGKNRIVPIADLAGIASEIAGPPRVEAPPPDVELTS